MTPLRPRLVLLTVGLGALMSTLDGSILNVSMPAIRTSLGVGIAQAQWVIVAYLLVMSSLLLTFGRLGDLLGHRRVYLAGFLLFGAASLVCAHATTLGVLVVGRGVQAVGAAALQSVAPALLTRSVPTANRGRALGLVSLFTYGGLTLGPSIGGALTHAFGWRSIFYVNLPVAAAALAMGSFALPRETASGRSQFDVPGAMAWATGLSALLLGLSTGAGSGYGSLGALSLFALAVALLVAFFAVERASEAPMIDLSLFRRRAFGGGVIAAFLNYVAVFSIAFLTPFRLVEDSGIAAARAGLILTAMPLAMAVTAPLSGELSDRIGVRLPATMGMALVALGLVLLGAARGESSFLVALAVCGVGTGLFVSPNTSAVLGSAPRHRQGIASGVVATARTTGMAFGVAIAGSVYALALRSLPEGASRGPAFASALAPAVVASLLAALASLMPGGDAPESDTAAQPPKAA